MNEEDDRDKREKWIKFICEVKNSQYNKMNSSTIKLGSIVVFLAAAIIFMIKNLPNRKPQSIKLYFGLIALNSLITISAIISGIFNNVFREKNIEGM